MPVLHGHLAPALRCGWDGVDTGWDGVGTGLGGGIETGLGGGIETDLGDGVETDLGFGVVIVSLTVPVSQLH